MARDERRAEAGDRPRRLAVEFDSRRAALDLILRKRDWYRQGGGASDRKWRDVLGVLKVQRERLDLAHRRHWASVLEVADLLERALSESGLLTR